MGSVSPNDGAAIDLALQATSIRKTFTGTQALDDVDFEVRRGEIHALLGGNGSGKSTLIKILSGVYRADPGGKVVVNGREFDVENLTASDARAAGMRFVHQNLGLFPEMTVAENLCAGPGFATSRGRIRWKDVNAHAQRLIDRFAISGARPTTPIAALRPADRTLVAIARALQDQEDASDGVLFLDEPTTALPPREVDALLKRLRSYAAAGQTIVLVSHRLHEIVEVADRVTVLRDGKKAATTEVAGVTETDLVELIVGKPVGQVYPPTVVAESSESALRVRGLSGGPVRGVDLDIQPGEIVGLGGLLGSGRSTLLHLLMGYRRRTAGTVEFNGKQLTLRSVREAMNAGFALVPEDRAQDAAFLDHTVSDNISAAEVASYWRGLRLRHRRERRDAVSLIGEFGINATTGQPMQTLSGGNQQKVILARWLRRNPKLLLLDEPTQGVDIGARVSIYRMIHDAADAGTAVVLVSSDFDELSHLCSRVVVLRNGRVVAEASGGELDPARLTELSFSGRSTSSQDTRKASA